MIFIFNKKVTVSDLMKQLLFNVRLLIQLISDLINQSL